MRPVGEHIACKLAVDFSTRLLTSLLAQVTHLKLFEPLSRFLSLLGPFPSYPGHSFTCMGGFITHLTLPHIPNTNCLRMGETSLTRCVHRVRDEMPVRACHSAHPTRPPPHRYLRHRHEHRRQVVYYYNYYYYYYYYINSHVRGVFIGSSRPSCHSFGVPAPRSVFIGVT